MNLNSDVVSTMMVLSVFVLLGFILAYWLFTCAMKQWHYIRNLKPFYEQPNSYIVRNHSVYIIKVEGENDPDRVYVGVTNNFARRLNEHKEQLERGKHKNHKLQETYDQGHRFLMHRLGREYTKLEAYGKEHQLRPRWNMGFNIAAGGLRGIHY